MRALDQASTLRAQTGRFEPHRSRARRAEDSPRVLGIVSGKGGVGKSTLATNLASACAERGARTLLVDADSGLANADLLLGVCPPFELSDWCAGRAALEATLFPVAGGLDLMVSGSGHEATSALGCAIAGEGEPELEAMLVSRSLTVLDLGAGIGSSVLDLARLCDPVWLVVTPEPTSLADAYAMARELWAKEATLRIEVVVNRAPDLETGERTYQALQRLTRRFVGREIRLRGVLLEDAAMARSVARQIPVVRSAPQAHIARQLTRLAETLVEEFATTERGGRAEAPASLILPG